MPQLDTVTFLTQYSWTLICLFLLFSLLVNIMLPRLQQQSMIRSKLGVNSLKERDPENIIWRSLWISEEYT